MSSEHNAKFKLIELGALAERTKLKISFKDFNDGKGYCVQDKNGLVVEKYYSLSELIAFLEGCDYVIQNKR
jgi:hypothetical protein